MGVKYVLNVDLGSVVALSDSAGDSVQSYEYSVYGEVAAEDPNFIANPYMFTIRYILKEVDGIDKMTSFSMENICQRVNCSEEKRLSLYYCFSWMSI
jgi:hypothetical protein